jgi:hypothetical protein
MVLDKVTLGLELLVDQILVKQDELIVIMFLPLGRIAGQIQVL